MMGENAMNYLEVTIQTVSGGIDAVAAALTAGGFSDLVLEDQAVKEEEEYKKGLI